MPTPIKDETEQHFVSRCISYLFNVEGERDKAHATAKCYGIYKQWEKENREARS